MEKKIQDSSSSHTIKTPISSIAQEKILERDEWMNIETFLPRISKSDIQKQKSNAKEVDKRETFQDKPGQSDRELNPYWKDGGDGVPQNNSKKHKSDSILDANWLKKSLQRAKEQALRDGRSLKEVAAERWGVR